MVALGFAGLPLAGCGPSVALVDGDGDGSNGGDGGDGGGGGDGGYVDYVVLATNTDVDILFVVDNSGSMGEEQAALAENLMGFIEILERPEVSANYRIGVTTTDNGNPWCPATGPEAGALQLTSCRSHPGDFVFEGAQTIDMSQQACFDLCPEEWTNIQIQPTAIEGSSEAKPRPWVENIAGRTNLPPGLSTTQAMQCLVPQGINGCGFESHLESMWKALGRSKTEGDPSYGFIRTSAVLAVVHMTDEVDCSYNSEWETIFLPDGDRVFWSDPNAAVPTSAVCWNAGVACSGSGTYDDCIAVDLDAGGNEISEANAATDAVLFPLSRYTDLLQALENDKQSTTPDQEVLVSVIGGANSDGTVTYQDAVGDPVFQRDFGIGPSCSGSNGSAVPPVRLRDFARAFQVAGQPNLFSICDRDYSRALEAVALAVAEQIKPACMPACVADTDPTTPDVVDPNCILHQETPNADGSFDEIAVPPCDGDELPSGADVCYQTLVGEQMDDFCVDVGFNLQFRLRRRAGFPAAGGTTVGAVCELSESRAIDCPDLR